MDYNFTGSSGLFENITNNSYVVTISDLDNQYFTQTYNLNVTDSMHYLNYSTYQSVINFRMRNIATTQFLNNYTINLTNIGSNVSTYRESGLSNTTSILYECY